MLSRKPGEIASERRADAWVKARIEELSHRKGLSLIDVGAGLSPYKSFIISQGIDYFSHDFNSYLPSQNSFLGLQNHDWIYPKHDFECDILEIPTIEKYDIVLCTEVLEHVPDPVATLKILQSLMKPGGTLIITVPLLSLIHQAPYYFSSGLSVYWFEHWAHKLNFREVSIEVSGDYVDFMEQEILRLFGNLRIFRLVKLLTPNLKHLRKSIPPSLLSSAGFDTLVVLELNE